MVNYQTYWKVPISQVKDHIGEIIYVQGKIIRVRFTEKATFFTLTDGIGKISCVSFDKVNIFVDEEVIVKGKVQIYRGKPELIVYELRCTNC